MNTTLTTDDLALLGAVVEAARSVIEADRVVMDLYTTGKPHPLQKMHAIRGRCARLRDLRLALLKLDKDHAGISGPSFVGV